MNGLQSSLYTAAFALCVFSAGLLRAKRAAGDRTVDYFTLFLGIEGLALGLEVLMVHEGTPLKALWLGLRMAISLWLAPCLWLAVREIVEGDRPRWTDIGRGHLAVIGLGMALTLPLIESTHLGLDYSSPEGGSLLPPRAIHAAMLGCIAVFAVQGPVFLWRCRRFLLADAGARGRAAPGWLQLPLIVVATTWGLGVLRTVQCAARAPQELTLIFAITEVGVTVAAIYVLMRHAALQGPAEKSASVAEVGNTATESAGLPVAIAAEEGAADPAPAGAKYARSKLPPLIRERVKQKLEHALREERVYRDSLLSLRTLSGRLKENVHYVSQVINQDLNASFYDLVNHHRVEEAKRLLVEAREQTVLEIALAVGFNSKSTFSTAFRRNTGTTPSAFRNAGLGEPEAGS